jgi:hypothetical protein
MTCIATPDAGPRRENPSISLLPSVDFVLTDEIEQCLTFHFDNVKKVVAAAIQAGDPVPHDDPPRRIG